MSLRAIDFELFLCLEIITPVFDIIALASGTLQNHCINLSTAYNEVDRVMNALSNLRTEGQFSEVYKNATDGKGS
ncbi:hypothetical protein E2C01_051365 [Portunus trituberculatus]|uniref:Uncharacterized protein n=1 Tax=Portunus trituberculatus TaxID=210409 RepID=A0A5B7GIH9_PORTR|nr:hypothetical protein [Portunus trituberculatus]